MMLCQEIAENFYPERALFTIRQEVGDDFAGNLLTSYPILTRRDLGDQIGSMLRPTSKEWFKSKPEDESRETYDAKKWLEHANKIQRQMMYTKQAQFNRAMKEQDHDFAAFGQSVISVTPIWETRSLLYRTWHLADVAWMEDEKGKIPLVARKWKPTAHDLDKLFGEKNHSSLASEMKQDPFGKGECYHIVCDADLYDIDAKGKPYISIYYDIKHDHLLEAVPTFNKEYVIPRWQTVSGSQYAYSPATIAALPDARLIQAMTYTLLEAGEKATTPPMIATQDAVRSDLALYAGGVTWVDMEYDERLGDALRPISQDTRGIPFGIDMQRDSKAMIMQAFYLNKLNLPQRTADMTAYEVGQRVQEYIRGALPLFEPMETEVNGGVCELTFDLLMRMGRFGSPHDIPSVLHGADINFKFESPLHDAIEQQKGQKWLESKGILAEAAAIDQSVIHMIDAKLALRDVLSGIGTPTKWLRSEEDVDALEQTMQQQAQNQQLMANLEQGSNVAANLGKAQKDFAG